MKNAIGQYFILVLAVLSGIMFYHIFIRSGDIQIPVAVQPALAYVQPTSEYVQPAYVAPTFDVHQVTVEAFYAAPAVSTSTPFPTPQPSTQLTTCMNTAIYSITNMSQEYVIGYLAQGMVVDVAARSSDSLWVKMAQGNSTYEFWIPADAFCFGD